MKKRFAAIILALALCMGLAVPVLAADTAGAELLSTFAIRRNGKYDETKNFYRSSHTGHIVWDADGKAEDVNFNVMTNQDSWTITNTGSTALLDGKDYVLRIHRTTCWQNTETDEVYDYTGDAYGDWWGSNHWFITDTFAPDDYNDETGHPVSLKRGESITIPAMAGEYHDEGIIQYKMDSGDVFNGPLYKIDIVAFVEGTDKGGVTVYSVYLHQDADEVKAKGVPQADPDPVINPGTPGTPDPIVPVFTDVPGWCANAVTWAAQNGVTTGATPTKFNPNTNCTHAQILTFLYRAARDGGTASAEDMDKAISWAREKELIDASFNPTAPCTRAQAVSYIWQAQGSEEAKASDFSDVAANAAYAAAVNWAVANGIVEGYPDGTFGPDKVCSRGSIAAMLYRAYVPEARLTAK